MEQECTSTGSPPGSAAGAPVSGSASSLRLWIARSIASWEGKRDLVEDLDASQLAAELTASGVVSVEDFKGLTAQEVQAIWPALASLPAAFVAHLLGRARFMAPLTVSDSSCSPATLPVQQSLLPQKRALEVPTMSAADIQQLSVSLASLRRARDSGVPPPSDEFAIVLRSLGELPQTAMEER